MNRMTTSLFSAAVSVILLLSLVACGNNADAPPSSSQAAETPIESEAQSLAANESPEIEEAENTETVLVAYYSHSSNTADVANQIHGLVGGDLFRITTVEPYPADYEEHIAQVREEIDSGYLPPLRELPETLDSYEVIYLGYPIWYRDIALPAKAFLAEYDLAGKTIIPFCTHEGTGAAESMESLSAILPDSTILELFDYDTYNRGASGARDEVTAWLGRLGVLGEERSDSPAESMSIVITAGDTVITAELDGSELAEEFVSLLPQTISMNRVRKREFYGEIQGALQTLGEVQTSFSNGDVAYWFSGNGFCLFYADDDTDGEVSSGIMVFGRMTSDLSALAGLDSTVQMTVKLA